MNGDKLRHCIDRTKETPKHVIVGIVGGHRTGVAHVIVPLAKELGPPYVRGALISVDCL